MPIGDLENSVFCGQCGTRLADDKTCPNRLCSMYAHRPGTGYSSTFLVEPPRESQQPSFTPRLNDFAEPTYTNHYPSQTQGTKIYPQRSTNRIYLIVITVLIVLLIGAVALNFVRTGQNNPQSTSNNTANASNKPTTSANPSPTIITTPTPVPTATTAPSPTPTSPPTVGTVLCQAGTSTGWNGWNGTSDWKIFNGMLLNDGTRWMSELTYRYPTIVAPCQLGDTPDYAVEVKMQITVLPGGDACFGIYVRGFSQGDSWQGYAGVVDQACEHRDVVRISADDDQGALVSAPFGPGTNFHTYRVEVKGTSLKFLIDGGTILQTTDSRYLSGGQVGFWDSKIELSISSFKITAL